MSDPKRLLDSPGPQGLSRSLLEAGAGLRLSPDRKAHLWQSIAARLPPPHDPGPDQGAGHPTAPPGGVHTLPAPPAASHEAPVDRPRSAPPGAKPETPAPTDLPPAPDAPLGPIPGLQAPLASTAAKIALGATLLALGGAAYLWIAPSPQPAPLPRPAVTTAQPAVSAQPAPPVAASAEAAIPPASPPRPAASGPADSPTTRRNPASEGPPAPRSPTEAAPATSAPPASPEPLPASPEPLPSASAPPPKTPEEIAQQERTNRLQEEATMTRAARSALRSGNPGEALRLIQQIQGKFGAGLLGQEREALTIEALGRSGQREQARTRAEAFLRAFPSSPHAQDVRMFAP